MSVRRIVLVALWMLSIVATAQWSARAQSWPQSVLSGPDIGFNVIGERDGLALGHLVVRVQGEWRGVIMTSSVSPTVTPGARIIPAQ